MKKFLVSLVIILGLGLSYSPVSAQGPDGATSATTGNNLICNIFPFLENVDSFGISSFCKGSDSTNDAVGFIRFLLSAVFVAIIIISIYVVIKSALKYIQSEGDDKKIGEASKAIKAVFVGIAALFVGVIGIIIVLAFFNSTQLTLNNGSGVPSIINDLLK